MEKNYSRRNLLSVSAKGIAALWASAAIGPVLIGGCKKSSPAVDAKEVQLTEFTCLNDESLSAQERAIRASLQYVDSAKNLAQRCDNCKVYTLPQNGSCGGCKIVPGPVHPKGYCAAWVRM